MKRDVHFPQIEFGLWTIELLRRAGAYGHALHYCRATRHLIKKCERTLARHRAEFHQPPRF